jgi:SAM-dependent methyltransferase
MDNGTEKTIKAFNESVDEYYAKTLKLAPSVEESIKKFIRLIPRNGRILDAGCGPGRDSKRFSELGYSVTGIDLAEKMIAFARKVAPSVKFEVMDLRKLKFGDKSFDGVWANSSLIFVRKSEATSVLGELSRILKKGGCLFVRVKEGDGEGMSRDGRYGRTEKYSAFYRREEFIRMIEEKGFTVLLTESESVPYQYVSHPFIVAYCKK